MRISEVIKVDHEFRYYRKAQTLLQTIDARMHWYTRFMRQQVLPFHYSRAAQISMYLDRELASKKLTWEVHAQLSARPILYLPTKQITEYIFSGLPEPRPARLTELEKSITELMTMRGRQIAANQHKFALMCEIAYRAKNGWYMIFNTLTVRPGAYYAVFTKDSQEFKRYIRRIDRLAAASSYDTIRAAIGRDYHSHFAVTEEGSKHGRLHIHCIHFLQKLPKGAYDPNLGKLKPTERELHCIRNIWTHGRSAPIIVRYSPNDAFGKLNYRWPIDFKTQEPMRIKSPLALANYLSKYITEGYNSCQRNKLLWRVKKSHKLGRQILDELTQQLSTLTLVAINQADNLRAKLNNQRIPQNLLRLSALRTLQSRLSTQPFKEYTCLTDLAKRASPRLSPLHYSRASTQTIQTYNQQNSQNSSITASETEDTYKKAQEELYNAATKIDHKYFPRYNKIGGSTSTRDHIYTTSNTNVSQIQQSKNRVRGSDKDVGKQHL